MFKMVCLDCGNKFNYEGWDRSVVCPKCESYYTTSERSYNAQKGFEKDLKEITEILRKKWNV